MSDASASRSENRSLYTEEQLERRQNTAWTTVQAVLAPLQFVVFIVSLALVIRFLLTGLGYEAATASIVLKTGCLYAIMITGAVWEKVVFGQYLFAPAFFWEDAFSFVVIALHTLYLVLLWQDETAATVLMWVALAAYATYVINAGQFLWKLRQARKSREHHA